MSKYLDFHKIKSILKFALENKYSRFYQKKYAGAGLIVPGSFKNWDDFKKLPVLTKHELTITPPFERLFCDFPQVSFVSHTSGTAGNAPLIIFKPRVGGDLLSGIQEIIKGLKTALILAQPSRALIGYNAFSQKNIPAFIGNVYKLGETAKIAAGLNIEAIYTAPDLLLKFAEFLKVAKSNFNRIKIIQFYGSGIADAHKDIFHRMFPNALLRQAYSSTEMSGIGFQCKKLAEQELPVYHIYESIFCETLADTNSIAGEIVLTHLKPQPSLMIRYTTGDLGQLLNKKCGCGSDSQLIQLMGRKNLDKVKLNGIEFGLGSFELVMMGLSSYVEDAFTAHFYHGIDDNKLVGKIVVDFKLKPNVKADQAIYVLIEEILNRDIRVSSQLSFKDLVAQELFFPIKANLIELPEFRYKTTVSKKLVQHF